MNEQTPEYRIFQLRRGDSEFVPQLHDGELAYFRDTNELIIGGEVGNITPSFNGGVLTDRRGRLTIRHGHSKDLKNIMPNELVFLEDKGTLAVGLYDNQYLLLNESLNQKLLDILETKADKDAPFDVGNLPAKSIGFSHLQNDVLSAIQENLSGQLEIILAKGSIQKEMIHDYAIVERAIAPNSITRTKIKNGSVSKTKLDPDIVSEIDILKDKVRKLETLVLIAYTKKEEGC